MATISKITNALAGGVAKPSRYYVLFVPPKNMTLISNAYDVLPVLAESIEMPGRQIQTREHMIYGVANKMPVGIIHNDFSATFICDKQMTAKKFFDGWHSNIFEPSSYYWNYYDDYTSVCLIAPADEEGIPTYLILVQQVYPVAIEAIQFNANATDEYLRLNVRFAFRTWLNPLNAKNVGLPIDADLLGVMTGGLSELGNINFGSVIESFSDFYGNMDVSFTGLGGFFETALDNLGIRD